MVFHVTEYMVIGVLFGAYYVIQIFSVETSDVLGELFEPKLALYIFAHLAGCRRGKRYKRRARKLVAQFAEFSVFRTEIVPPFRNAVRFVNGDERNFNAGKK